MKTLRIASKLLVCWATVWAVLLSLQTATAAVGDSSDSNTSPRTAVSTSVSALPTAKTIKISSRSIPFEFPAVAGHRYQLVVAKAPTLLGGITRLFEPKKSGTAKLDVTVSTTGTWFTAVQHVSPTVEPITQVRKVVISASAAQAPTLRVTQEAIASGQILLNVAGAQSGTLREFRIQSSSRNSKSYTFTTTATHSLVLPTGAWNVAVRLASTTSRDASAWSPTQRVSISGRKVLSQPKPPRHGGRDAQGNPKIILSLKAGVSYWIIRGNTLLHPIAASKSSVTKSVPVELPCEMVAPARVIAVNSLGNYSQVSNLITLKGAPCQKMSALAPPSNFELEDASYTSVTLSFNPLSNSSQNYLLQRDGLAVGSISGKQDSITLERLTESATFTWDLYRRNAQGFVSPRPARVIAATRPPVQSTGSVRAFMLATDVVSINDARAHYMSLDWVYPTYFEIDKATQGLGQISGQSQPHVDTWFRKRGVKVLPRILAADLSTLEALWATSELRQSFAEQVKQLVSAGSYDGIQLDFEPFFPKTGIAGSGHSETPATRAAYYASLQTDVVRRIHELLSPLGKKVSFAIPLNWCSGNRSVSTWRTTYCSNIADKSVVTRPRMQLYDVPGILKYSDDIFVMAWGQHWGTSEPGASGELDWIQAGVTWLQNVIAQQRSLDPDSVVAEVTLGRNLYSSVYYYSLVRTDTARPPAAIAKAPLCPKTQIASRARLRLAPNGWLSVDWVCPELRADKLEYSDAIPVGKTSASPRGVYQVDDGETLVKLPSKNGFYAELWLADVRSQIDFNDIAKAAGWKIGLWRLGREDQRVWDLPEIRPAS